MFKDLLSNLPHNPHLRADILFYSERLRQESGVRLIGFAFLVLAMLVQLSAAAYHPQKTLAAFPSDNGLTPADNAYCSASASLVPGSTTDVSVTTGVFNGLPPAAYQYDVDANGSVDFSIYTAQNPYTHTFTGLGMGTHTILVNVLLRSPPKYNNGIYHFTTCQTQITINPPEQAKVVTSKSVSDTTQGLADANGHTAKAGDELVFKLTTQNVTSSDFKNYSGRDNFASVLQYAAAPNQSELSNQAINLDANGFLNWTTLNLKAHTTEVKTVTVRVKDSLPAKTANNCVITNSYGNQVIVVLACPTPTTPTEPPPTVSQHINKVATKLPNTGPGTTVAIAFFVSTIAGYFLSRSRIMAQELALAADHQSTGEPS